MKEKREIKGIKDTNENYNGNAYGIIKKIIALVLAAGMVITAAEAIRMYNQWHASKTQGTQIGQQDKLKDVSFEDVKSIVEEYRKALQDNDLEKIKSLEIKVREGNYFEVLFSGFKEQMVESLGFDSKKVEVVIARDGVFLVDKEKAKGKVIVDHTGQISNKVKYIDGKGKNPQIPMEMKNMVSALGTDMSAAKFKGMSDLEGHFSNYEELLTYVAEKDIGERE